METIGNLLNVNRASNLNTNASSEERKEQHAAIATNGEAVCKCHSSRGVDRRSSNNVSNDNNYIGDNSRSSVSLSEN